MALFLLLIFCCLNKALHVCAVHSSASSDWSGEYQDTTFGGSLFVCISYVTESDTTTTIIGQGVFSQFGYMRGEVMGNQWVGEFFMAGLESRHGTFNFTLDDEYGTSYR